MDLNILITRLDSDLAYAREQLDKFAAELTRPDGDPSYALAWADKHFRYAAHVKVASELLAICREHSIDDLVSSLGAQVLRGARYPSQSTSQSTNMMEENLLAVRAEYLEWIEARNH